MRVLGPLAVGAVVGTLFVLSAPDQASGDFYYAASQIIAVLMLALIIESSVFAAVLGLRHDRFRRPPLGRIGRAIDPYVPLMLVGLSGLAAAPATSNASRGRAPR